MNVASDRPSAVVVGLCAHGLTLARALHYAGIRVVALEADPDLPGTSTTCADVRIVPDINGVGLLDSLVSLRDALRLDNPPVLFLTNDRMVETVGAHVEPIASRYRLSWASSPGPVLSLLHKENIERRCREVGLNYPRTRLVTSGDSWFAETEGLRYPLIVKPTKPLSAFKTIVADSPSSISRSRALIEASAPVIVQEFVPGDDRSIRFGALYLDEGRIVARFEGRKLRSRPMGHTTIAVSERNEEVHELTAQFFRGLNISGPVSLELKRGSNGTDWVIEPTVGRTDFWIGLCIANNVNIPLIEYSTQIAHQAIACPQTDTHVWINGERDPGAVVWLLAHSPTTLLRRRLKGVYADGHDLRPWAAALASYTVALAARALRKAKNVIFPRSQATGR